jgi:hypothetical protein
MSTVGGCCQQLKKHLEFAHRSSSLESTHATSILFLDSILTFVIRAMSNHSCTPPLTHHVRSSSPVPWKPRYSGREVVIERVVEKPPWQSSISSSLAPIMSNGHWLCEGIFRRRDCGMSSIRGMVITMKTRMLWWLSELCHRRCRLV